MKRALLRRDLLELESRLRESLSKVLSFEAHAVYFPQDVRSTDPEWLPDEGRLLLPLVLRGEVLGVFTAKLSDGARVEALLPSLPGIAELCLENLELFKLGRLDPTTGLSTRNALLGRLSQEIESVRASFAHDFGGGKPPSVGGGSLGLVVLRFDGARELARSAGCVFADKMTEALADAFAEGLPEQALGARTDETAFAAFAPGASRRECEALAEDLLRRTAQVRLPDPLTGRGLGVAVCAGFSVYPQDMDADRRRSVEEQPRLLLRKAEIAAAAARKRPAGLSPSRVVGYGSLLLDGGSVRRTLPFSRVLTDLGRSVGAREGQRFSVWTSGAADGDGPRPLYKGEIVLLEVREAASTAEVIHLGDPAQPLEPGDALTLLPADQTAAPSDGALPPAPDPSTGLLRHGDFLARLPKACAGRDRFGLVLLHADFAAEKGEDGLPEEEPERLAAQVSALCRDAFSRTDGEAPLGGRFGLNTLIFCHPDRGPEELEALYGALCAEAASRLSLRLAAGIAFWPFLRFRQAEMIECARKALEFALLLPPPRVGLFGSLAMNVDADELHSKGDVFGAVEEYKLSLLADPDNALAWNSLGVCAATLGRRAEARGFLEEAAKRTPDDPSIAYNLGAVCRALGDDEAAKAHFSRCLALSPGHMYATVRLGELAEASGDLDAARALYEEAAKLDVSSPLPFRRLALLERREGRPEAARERLHQALLRNPRDAAALGLMAELYLDGGEDPELAASLARQSAARRPDLRQGWLALARALEALGRPSEAREALLKAGEA